MFRIRKVLDNTTPANRQVVADVQAILRAQFPLLDESDVNKLPDAMRDPLKYAFRSELLVAENGKGRILGFAVLQHAPDLNFAYLDFISAAPGATGGGIGSALYERVREEALALGVIGLFFECLPDDPALCRDPDIRRQNSARLKFYERYGARPIAHTRYETPLKENEDNPPYLVVDALGNTQPLRRDHARAIVKAILERKYSALCPKSYIDMVVKSFIDDPVVLRPPHYAGKKDARAMAPIPVRRRRIALTVNDKHSIHHIRERGYVESPVRISSILNEINGTGLFEPLATRHFSLDHVKAVHDREYVAYLKNACEQIPAGKSVYPYIFPIRNVTRPPKALPLRAGYYCIDTFTPLNANAFLAALGAVDCALTCAYSLLEGYRLSYALVRPPGHHAERRSFGGFCYFNSSAIAAQVLSRFGKVAILDVDYHHGNGTQDIFYERADVFTVSLHGNPRYTYPYFSGFEEEKGAREGTGYNLNIPLPENLNGAQYREHLARAIRAIERYSPRYLVVGLGLDTAKGDPTGSFTLGAKDFRENGAMIGAMNLPTVVVQEGGYKTRSLGTNARHFFEGLWHGQHDKPPRESRPRASTAKKAAERSVQ